MALLIAASASRTVSIASLEWYGHSGLGAQYPRGAWSVGQSFGPPSCCRALVSPGSIFRFLAAGVICFSPGLSRLADFLEGGAGVASLTGHTGHCSASHHLEAAPACAGVGRTDPHAQLSVRLCLGDELTRLHRSRGLTLYKTCLPNRGYLAGYAVGAWLRTCRARGAR